MRSRSRLTFVKQTNHRRHPTLPAAEGEVVAGGQRVGVIRTEHPLLRGEQPVEFGDRAGDSPHPAGSPAARPRSILGRVNVAVPTCVVLTRALSSRLSRVA